MVLKNQEIPPIEPLWGFEGLILPYCPIIISPALVLDRQKEVGLFYMTTSLDEVLELLLDALEMLMGILDLALVKDPSSLFKGSS